MGLYVADLKSRQGGPQRLCGTQRQCRRTTSAAPAHSQIYFTRYIGAGLLVPTPVARRLDADEMPLEDQEPRTSPSD
jgi:hypothetical protein